FPLCVGVAGLVWAFADVLSLFCRGASGKPLGKEKPEMCLGLSLLKATPVNFSIFIFLKRGHKQHCANLSKGNTFFTLCDVQQWGTDLSYSS
uniref:Uncharacterized protein n=1 Tax=Otus sunia TaxID=257818 RepID=A0A8C8A925_9STRI